MDGWGCFQVRARRRFEAQLRARNGVKECPLNLVYLMLRAWCFAFVVFQLQAGETVTLGWDPNSESDLAGYNFYYGPASRSYTNKLDLGNVTTVTISNL